MDGSAPHANKKLHILTWGCQMNEYDSTRMADLLAPLGYSTTPAPDDADLVILNTCHIREKAAEKIFSELGRLRMKQKAREEAGDKMMIAVAGCVAQAEGKEIRKRAPYVDLVFGPQVYHRLPEMLTKALRETGGVVNTSFPAESKFDFLPEEASKRGVSAFLSVQEGCDKFCTFCVVPYTRGAETSRPASSILAEAKRLLASGVREITLLGQNVNAWHGEGLNGETWSFGRLIRELAELPDLLRIRYTTSHPRDMDDDLINAHRDVPQLMPFLHLPVQSGSTRLLRAMNRGHAREDYLRLIEKIRTAQPAMAFSSDFIIGFPGETDQDFEDTMKLLREVNYAQAFSFKYSSRPGTPAAAMANPVPEDVKTARLEEIQKELFNQQRAFNEALLGKKVPVLFEINRSGTGLHGRTIYMQAVHLDLNKAIPGQVTDVTITSAGLNSLEGDVCA